MSAPRFYHAPARRAIRGTAYTIFASTSAEVQSVCAVCSHTKTLLLPTGEYGNLRLWQGELMPPMGVDTLTYTLCADLVPMGEYTVPLSPINLAPIAISELYLRARTMHTPYIEVMNTTDAPIDLADYALMWKRGTLDADFPVNRIPISPRAGETIIPPRSTAVLWVAFALTHDSSSPCLTAEDFYARLAADHTWCGFSAVPDEVNLIRIEACDEAEDGTWHNKADFAPFPVLRPWDTITLGIAPLGASLDDAVSRVTLNTNINSPWHNDVSVRRASLWQTDIFGGAAVRMLTSSAPISPGILDAAQRIPDPHTDKPLGIAPLRLPDEHPLSDGKLNLSWAVFGGDACASRIRCVQENDTICFDAAEENGIWSITLPADLIDRQEMLSLTIEADNGSFTTALETSIRIIDNAGPVVTAMTPDNGYAAFVSQSIELRADYFDRSGVDAYTSRLYLDGMDISHKAIWTSSGVRCTLEKLKRGQHKIALKLYDCLGNASRTVSYFRMVGQDELHCYRGEVHAHTQDSDGVGTPEDAMTYAHEMGGVDYFAVTEHGHHISQKIYDKQKAAAAAHNIPHQYAVLQGWEMTWNNETGYWGHINILESDFIHFDIRSMDMPALFSAFADDPTAIGMFNHPCYAWGNFDEFAHLTADADRVMCLDEIKSAAYDTAHALALAKGWHVAPVSNEDTHQFNWTTATPQTGFILAPALTRQNVAEAFRARRTYSTSDPTLHLRFRVNGAWLGSRIPATDLLTIDLQLETRRPEGLGVISIIGEDNITVAEWDVGVQKQFARRIHLPADFDYYYLKLVNPLVEGDYTVSAPVWIEGRDALAITDMALALTGGQASNLVSVSLCNNTADAVTDLRAEFYLSPAEGFGLGKTLPYHTAYLGKLAAGERITTERTFPNIADCRRVSVIVSGRIGKHRYADTRYLMLTPVSIVEILPDSSAITLADGRSITNPFTYAVLFNHTNEPLNLDGAQLRQWTKTGKQPSPKHCHPLDGITIPPRGTVTLWLRGEDSPLTAAEFNAHFGCALIEGVDLICIDRAPLSDKHTAARRLDLCLGEETLNRVHWNYAADFGHQPTTDRALRYCFRGSMTATSVLIDEAAVPSPAGVDREQLPTSRAYRIPDAELRRERKAKKKQKKLTRKPEKKGLSSAAATALGIGSAAVGAAVGAGSALLAVLLADRHTEDRS